MAIYLVYIDTKDSPPTCIQEPVLLKANSWDDAKAYADNYLLPRAIREQFKEQFPKISFDSVDDLKKQSQPVYLAYLTAVAYSSTTVSPAIKVITVK